MSIPQTVSIPPIVPVPAAIPTPMKLKREPSGDFDEKPESPSQGFKRARTASMKHKVPGSMDAPKSPCPPKPTHTPKPTAVPGPTAVPESTDKTRPTKKHRRGCPGNCWECKPAELSKRKYWTSFKKFRAHFASHMHDYRMEGCRWQCDLCNHDSFGGDGYDLMKHLWDTHFE
jgi:hypothetical protein